MRVRTILWKADRQGYAVGGWRGLFDAARMLRTMRGCAMYDNDFRPTKKYCHRWVVTWP